MPKPVVTISASYGAGGSQIAPEVARRLDVRFYDRAIPSEVARRLAVPLDQALARDEAVGGTLERLLNSFAVLGTWYDPGMVPAITDRHLKDETERLLRETAGGDGGAVLLGRAAAMVLRDTAGAIHVRLDGPAEARAAQAVRLEGLDEDTASHRLSETDRAREAYVRQFYGVDPRDPRHYHVVLDSTALAVLPPPRRRPLRRPTNVSAIRDGQFVATGSPRARFTYVVYNTP